MKRTARRIGCLFIAMILSMLTVGCGKKEARTVQTDMSDLGVISAWTPLDAIPVPKNQNLLTGLGNLSEEAIGKRPVAVMINNVEPALPQYGIAQADVIFELPVEGDLTRIMALYADYTKVPDVCAIRSCRYYFPAIAKGFDAFYVHWGSDQTILGYLKSIQPDKFDGLSNDGGLFARDTARKQAGYALEHTGYFKGTQFAEAVKASKRRLELSGNKTDTAFKFADYGNTVTPTGGTCNTVSVRFGASSSKFEYDAQTNTYLKSMNGHTHIDSRTGDQLSFTNVFVLETSISTRDSVGHKEINWKGGNGAKGYYISNGAVQRITWSQSSESSYLKFYNENGKELEINRGKSYVAYTSSGKTTIE